MAGVKETNKRIEKTVVSNYQTVEDTVITGYRKIEDRFVDLFLRREEETIAEAKERVRAEQRAREQMNCGKNPYRMNHDGREDRRKR